MLDTNLLSTLWPIDEDLTVKRFKDFLKLHHAR